MRSKGREMKFVSSVAFYCLFSTISTTCIFAEEAFVKASNLNLRNTPGNGKIIETIPMGKKIKVLVRQNGWAKVTYSNLEGWVSQRYLTSSSFREIQRRYPRVRDAIAEKGKIVEEILGNFSASSKILIVAYKIERILQIWFLNSQNKQLELKKSYEFSGYSGDIGPKRRQGDLQIPEGFYVIDRFNPNSSFHLSLGINYPNASDRILGIQGSLGGDIFLHGSSVTIGCIPITDDKIKELYLTAVEAKSDGQNNIPVYIFPCKMNEESCTNILAENSEYHSFWENIEEGYNLFNENHNFLEISIDENGLYHFN
jgi:murein L,D-transpeptidase YafK|tara:strand:+ start:103 stop:1041 length:939 start_codon:yes stop_codon:yes gene_type:complete